MSKPASGEEISFPVHPVGEPRDRGLVLDNGGGFRLGRRAGVGELLDIGSYLVEPSHVGRRSDDCIDELTSFPRSRVFLHLDLRGSRFGQRLQIFEHLGMRDDPIAWGVAKTCSIVGTEAS